MYLLTYERPQNAETLGRPERSLGRRWQAYSVPWMDGEGMTVCPQEFSLRSRSFGPRASIHGICILPDVG